MRSLHYLVLTSGLLFAGCSADVAQSHGTTPEPAASTSEAAPVEESGSDDIRQRSLEAAAAVGESLGPILATVTDDRAFEACERADDLMNRAAALREVGVPEGVGDGEAFREELAQLHQATTMMSTHCGRGVETVPPDFWVPSELTFYRLMLRLDPSMGGAASESSHIVAARAVRELLGPITQAHREDRVGALCQSIEPLVASVERLEGEGMPPDLSAPRHYGEEMARLVETATTAATGCDDGSESMSAGVTITLEVTALRLWFMLHDRWPGSS